MSGETKSPWPMAPDDVTLRDYFAAAALPGFIAACFRGAAEAGDEEKFPLVAAGCVYAIADAMLAERAKK